MVAGVATSIAFIASSRRAPADVRSTRFEVSAPEGATLSPSGAAMSLSPDGRYLALTALVGGRSVLFLRALDSLVARELPGSDGAAGPFWSADSRFIAFAAGGKLKSVGITGGPPQTLCDAPSGSGTWNREGTILIGSGGGSGGSGGGSGGGGARRATNAAGLLRVSVAEGVPTRLTTLDQSREEISHQWPQFLPDGRHYLFMVRSLRPEHTGIYVGSLGSQERTRLLSADSNASYAPPGQLLFRRATTLMAQPFDARTLTLSGEPIVIADSVAFSSGGGRTMFALSETGVLAYRGGVDKQLMWYDRAGRQLGAVTGSGDDPALSPDNTRLAIDRLDPVTGTKNIWVVDLSRGTASRLTFHRWDIAPVWSPDGSRVAFGSNRDGPMNIYQRVWTGASDDEPVFKSATDKVPADWSRDGRFILYSGLQVDPVGPGVRSANALWSLPLIGSRQPSRLLETPFSVATAQLSPDGRWVAYTANESGIDEVYVRSFPAGEGKWQISMHGGGEPKWRGDGRELFYLAADQRMMAAPVKTGATLEAGLPAALFETRAISSSGLGVLGRNQYVVTADGQRFLINQPTTASPPITVVTNWMASLR
jgi:Tol biopolymer transport system component